MKPATKDIREILRVLNDAQREAVTNTIGHLLVLAGAGTGKTRVIVARIAFLLNQGVRPERILAVTFTRRAAREMQERVRAVTGSPGAFVRITTFHSLGFRILRQQAVCVGLPQGVRVIAEDQQRVLLRNIFNGLPLLERPDSIEKLQAAISLAKNQGVPPHRLTDDLTAYVYQRYQAELAATGTIDLDDMVLAPVRLLQDDTEIAERYRQTWQYIMVDEYQDTNRGQYQLLRCLLGADQSLCVVGDDDQSIYAFRGAEAGRMLAFHHDFPEAATITLESNYRSTIPIVALANEVISGARRRFPKRLRSENGSGPAVVWRNATDEADELSWLVHVITDLVCQGIPAGDIAVLLRVRAHILPIRHAFLQRRTASAGSDKDLDGVKLMTLHQAKGLEFRAVFLPCMEENVLPHANARTDEELDEERRLFYVGLTRARERLFLSSCKMRRGRPQQISRFLVENSRVGLLVRSI